MRVHTHTQTCLCENVERKTRMTSFQQVQRSLCTEGETGLTTSSVVISHMLCTLNLLFWLSSFSTTTEILV